MSKYTQSSEGDIINEYFKGVTSGTLLDIGANNGATFSNSLELIENGWSAVLVEPSEEAFRQLITLHTGRKHVHCFNLAIGAKSGHVDFYESESILPDKKDHSLVSTTVPDEMKRWNGATTFTKKNVLCYSFKEFMERCVPARAGFDLISIDVEGAEMDILEQMNLNDLRCQLLVIEFNGHQHIKKQFDAHILPFGMKLIHTNAENLIYAK